MTDLIEMVTPAGIVPMTKKEAEKLDGKTVKVLDKETKKEVDFTYRKVSAVPETKKFKKKKGK